MGMELREKLLSFIYISSLAFTNRCLGKEDQGWHGHLSQLSAISERWRNEGKKATAKTVNGQEQNVTKN